MKHDKIERHAVPEDRLERFMGLVYSLTEPFGINEIPEVWHYVELLGQAIERQIAESKFIGNPAHRSTAERKKFIAIFQNRYLHLTDLEYNRGITGIDGKMINQLCKLLTDNGFEVDEFLAWLFDEYLRDNPKFCPPSIKFCCSNFIIDKFLYENKEQIKQRKAQTIRQKEILDLIGRARILIRVFEEDKISKEKVVKLLTDFKSVGIIETLRSEIETLERSVRNSQETQKATNGQKEGE